MMFLHRSRMIPNPSLPKSRCNSFKQNKKLSKDNQKQILITCSVRVSVFEAS